MTLRISGKNVDVGDAMRVHAQERIDDALSKYFDGGYDGTVTLGREGSGYRAECKIHLDTGVVLQTSADSQDPRVSFDQAADRIEKRLRRYKRKLKDHHNGDKGADAFAATAYVIASPEDDEELEENFNPIVIAETPERVKTLTVGMAVMEMDLTEVPLIMFRNAGNGGLNVVYRRSDGNIGWIDPSLVAQGTNNA
ncbi:ribosome-associated translation inhibitor RaiA [Breoghania sp. L-A4]|uniref:ribosome hibernation-promoting factor, HPF/YfiA family n=1 Tax=Breoghania sp. L-A4 TaxID=2304600 RepID=UPI000E3583B5|nr:ribosome-associated translation inhibitor RaiA [Breoghania sp. L-A4]AXS39145.1 ribosome-associated translation inhibitor RaiA [Breoghania sp. L-A4]